jgi:hypothetical protein
MQHLYKIRVRWTPQHFNHAQKLREDGIKLFHYRPGQEVKDTRISRKSVHEGGKVPAESPLPPVRSPLYSFLLQAESSGRMKSMKNCEDPNRNRTHDLPSCSAVPQPTSPPRAPSE